MNEAEPQDAGFGITPHGANGTHGVEITSPSHHPMGGKGIGHPLSWPRRVQRHGWDAACRAINPGTSQNTDIIAVAKKIEQRCQRPVLMPALQGAHLS